MGQSSKGGGGSLSGGLLSGPQQQLASKLTGSTLAQKSLAAAPVDVGTKTRMAGQVIGLTDTSPESDTTQGSVSYSNKPMKTGYYSQVGMQPPA